MLRLKCVFYALVLVVVHVTIVHAATPWYRYYYFPVFPINTHTSSRAVCGVQPSDPNKCVVYTCDEGTWSFKKSLKKCQPGNACAPASGDCMPLPVTAISLPVSSISAGDGFTCYIHDNEGIATDKGLVKCFGKNDQGQLGNGTKIDAGNIAQSTGLSNVKSISSGASQTCALMVDSTVMCWGNGVISPKIVAMDSSGVPLSKVLQVVVGDKHACVLLNTGEVMCWGDNSSGQVGVPGDTFAYPTKVPGISDATVISAGAVHSCAATKNSGIVCWGFMGHGVGSGPSFSQGAKSIVIQDVTQYGSGATALISGQGIDCFLLTDGLPRCWADTQAFEYFYSKTPQPLTGMSDIISLFARNASHWNPVPFRQDVCGITTQGTVKCYVNGANQVIEKKFDLPAIDVTIGATHACARLVDSSVKCWGSNDYDQMGSFEDLLGEPQCSNDQPKCYKENEGYTDSKLVCNPKTGFVYCDTAAVADQTFSCGADGKISCSIPKKPETCPNLFFSKEVMPTCCVDGKALCGSSGTAVKCDDKGTLYCGETSYPNSQYVLSCPSPSSSPYEIPTCAFKPYGIPICENSVTKCSKPFGKLSCDANGVAQCAATTLYTSFSPSCAGDKVVCQ